MAAARSTPPSGASTGGPVDRDPAHPAADDLLDDQPVAVEVDRLAGRAAPGRTRPAPARRRCSRPRGRSCAPARPPARTGRRRPRPAAGRRRRPGSARPRRCRARPGSRPTICSRMSSSVTRPAVPPNSSTTTARWLGPRWKSRSWRSSVLPSGTKAAGRMSVCQGVSVAVARGQDVLGVDHAGHRVGMAVVDQQAGVLRAPERRRDLLARRRTSPRRRCRSAAS